MNLQQLYYFRTIARLEHYTEAAKQLGITQSSLSHSIADLEQELQAELFLRHGRNVKLTRYGAFFLEYVDKALDTLEEGRERLKSYVSPDRGMISLTYLSSLNRFIPYLISRYYEQTGNMQVRFQFQQTSNSEVHAMLKDGRADLGFSSMADDSGMISARIGFQNFILVVPENHPLAQRDKVSISSIAQEKLITYNSECYIRQLVEQVLNQYHIHPQIVSEAIYDDILLGLVAAGFGVALMPNTTSLTPGVKKIDIEEETNPIEVKMVWMNDHFISPAAESFRDFVLDSGLILDEMLSAE